MDPEGGHRNLFRNRHNAILSKKCIFLKKLLLIKKFSYFILFVFVLLSSPNFISVFNPVNSEFEKESICLKQLKCLKREMPNCLKVEQHNQTVGHMMVLNECQLQYMKCHEGMDAVAALMNHCHYANGTGHLQINKKTKNLPKKRSDLDYLPNRVISDTRQRDLGFMIDLSLPESEKEKIKEVVKLIAEEAVNFYQVNFLAFSFSGTGILNYSQTSDVGEFIREFNVLIDHDVGRDDPCPKRILSDIRRVLDSDQSGIKWRANINSNLYVFTHSNAEDYDEFHKWKRGNVKVTFFWFITYCYVRDIRLNPGFEVLLKLAILTQGQFIRLGRADDAMKLQKYVRHTALEFDSRVLASMNLQHGNIVAFTNTMSGAVFLLISVSGSQVDFGVSTTFYSEDRYRPEFILNEMHTKLHRYLDNYKSYVVRPDNSLHYSAGTLNISLNIMVSKIDFAFQYQFSKVQKWRNRLRRDTSNEGDSKKPKYLIIYVTEKRKYVEVKKVKFIELDENGNEVIFESHALVKTAEDTYATEYRIGIPNLDFFIVASGTIKGNGVVMEVDSQENKYKESEHQDDSSESVLLLKGENNNERKDQKLQRWKQNRGSCPAQCPARGVLVCARCQHGVHRTFLSVCHMRMYQCKHPGDKLSLVARRSCTGVAPFLGDLSRPAETLDEPYDEDVVLSHIYAKQGLYTPPQK